MGKVSEVRERRKGDGRRERCFDDLVVINLRFVNIRGWLRRLLLVAILELFDLFWCEVLDRCVSKP